MHTYTLLAAAVACLAWPSVQAVRFTDCGGSAASGQIDLAKVEIQGCDAKASRCVFPRGQDASMSLPFTPTAEITALKAKVTAYIGVVPIPFNLPQPDACQDSGLTCPLTTGAEVTYTAALPILKQYPPISLNVRWELVDQNGHIAACIKFPVKVKA